MILIPPSPPPLLSLSVACSLPCPLAPAQYAFSGNMYQSLYIDLFGYLLTDQLGSPVFLRMMQLRNNSEQFCVRSTFQFLIRSKIVPIFIPFVGWHPAIRGFLKLLQFPVKTNSHAILAAKWKRRHRTEAIMKRIFGCGGRGGAKQKQNYKMTQRKFNLPLHFLKVSLKFCFEMPPLINE